MPEKPSQPIFYDPENRRWRWFKGVTQLLGVLLTLVFCGLITSILTTPILPSLALAPIKPLLGQSHASAPTPMPTALPTIQLQNLQTQVLQQARVETRHQELFGIKEPVRAIKRFHVSQKNPTVSAAPPSGPSVSSSLTPIAGSSLSTPTPAFTPAPAPIFNPVNPVAPVSPANTEVIGFYVDWDDNSFTSLKQNISHIDKLIPEWLHLTDATGTIAPDDLRQQQEQRTSST